MTGLRFFSSAELRCPRTGEIRLATGFGAALDTLRATFGKPMVLTSACRSPEHNRAINGHPRSLHLIKNPVHPVDGCCAVDVAMSDGNDRGRLASIAWARGFSVGVASNFVHLDWRVEIGLEQKMFHYRR